MNINETHWALVHVDTLGKRILYYDSLGWSGRLYLETTLKWFQDWSVDVRGQTLAELTPLGQAWELIEVPLSAQPQQTENPLADCGVFV